MLGVYGFNAVLTGIALGGSLRDWRTPLAGIVLSILLMKLMVSLHLPTLTAPFILATWIVLAWRKWNPASRVPLSRPVIPERFLAGGSEKNAPE